MQEEPKEKVGKLTYVAKTAGVHLDNNSEWINPANEKKDELIAQIEWMKGNIGFDVKLQLNDKGYYTKMDVVGKTAKKKTQEKEKPVPVEEVKDVPKKSQGAKKAPESTIGKTGGSKPQTEISMGKETTKTGEAYSIPKEGHMEITGTFTFDPVQSWDKDYFNDLNKQECHTEKKNNLTYISWAYAWETLKKLHSDAAYHVYENENGMPYFHDKVGAFVKVSVTICSLTHTVFLPVMDYSNKGLKLENMSTFDINKSIQRALAKAIAMHGLGLYVYRGEDIPENPQLGETDSGTPTGASPGATAKEEYEESHDGSGYE